MTPEIRLRVLLFFVSAWWNALEQRQIDRVAHAALAEVTLTQVAAAIVDRQHAPSKAPGHGFGH
jgi:hypothetical protein